MIGRFLFIFPVLLALAMVLVGCAGICPFAARSMAEKNKHLQHVVLIWLKESGNAEHRRLLIEACESFRAIPRVQAVRVGEPVLSGRGIVDDTYDIALLVTVEDRAALQAFLDHPIHVAAREERLQPLAQRVMIYDFQHRARPLDGPDGDR